MFATAIWSIRDNAIARHSHNQNKKIDNENGTDKDNNNDGDNNNDNDKDQDILGPRSGLTRWPSEIFAPPFSLGPPSACSEGRTGSITSPPPITQSAVPSVAHVAADWVVGVGDDEVSEFVVPSVHPVGALSEDGGVNVCDGHLVDH